MPIAVVCPGCKTRFAVNEKFAGKQGPCPKCKAVITIPAAAEEVKIHAPEEFASASKTATGHAATRPVRFREARFRPLVAAGVAGGTAAVFAAAWALRGLNQQWPVIAGGLLVLSPVIAVGGYLFLRNRELEAYRGRALWLRAACCGAAYAALWGVYWPLNQYGVIGGEPWQLIALGAAFAAVGGGAAFAAFDFEFGAGAVHYGFYLLVTLALRAAIGLPPIWASVTP